jgi:hypothetical protein
MWPTGGFIGSHHNSAEHKSRQNGSQLQRHSFGHNRLDVHAPLDRVLLPAIPPQPAAEVDAWLLNRICPLERPWNGLVRRIQPRPVLLSRSTWAVCAPPPYEPRTCRTAKRRRVCRAWQRNHHSHLFPVLSKTVEILEGECEGGRMGPRPLLGLYWPHRPGHFGRCRRPALNGMGMDRCGTY